MSNTTNAATITRSVKKHLADKGIDTRTSRVRTTLQPSGRQGGGYLWCTFVFAQGELRDQIFTALADYREGLAEVDDKYDSFISLSQPEDVMAQLEAQELSKAAKQAKRDEDLAKAEADGRKAYAEHRLSAPTLSPVVRALIENEAVGSGYARRIFQAWDEGYQAAADEAAAKALRDDEPAFPTELSKGALAAVPEIVAFLRGKALKGRGKIYVDGLATAASALELQEELQNPGPSFLDVLAETLRLD